MQDRRPRTGALAIVLLLALDGLIFLGGVALVVLNGSGAARWFQEGGPWMFFIALLLLVQAGMALLLGILHLGRRIPLPLYLLVPTLVVVVGVLGRMLGVQEGFEAIAMAAPDQQAVMWSMVLSIADIPRAFAFFVLSSGGLFLVAATGLAAFNRREPGKHGAFAAIAGGPAGVAALAVVILGLIEGQSSGTGQRPILFGVALLLGVLPVALAAPGLKHLAGSDSEDDRVMGFSLALGLGLGLVLTALGLTVAFVSSDRTAALSALAQAPPDMRAAMMTASFAASRGSSILGTIALFAALFAAAPGVIFAASGATAWVRRHPVQLIGLVLLVGLGAGIDRLGAFSEAGRHEIVLEALQSKIPPELQLPLADAGTGLAPRGQLFILREGKLVPADESAGPAGEERTLALPASTSGATLRELSDGLQRAGVQRIFLAVHRRPEGEAPDLTFKAERRRRLEALGVPGELVLLIEDPGATLELRLADRVSELSAPEDGPRPLALMLELSGGEVTISGTGSKQPPLPATPRGEVDRAALGRKLEEIKDAFPDENTIAIHPDDTTSLQQVVDALEATHSSGPNDWERRELFPQAALVSSASRPEPAPLPTKDAGGILGILGAAPNANSAGDGYGHGLEETAAPGTAVGAPVVMGSLDRSVIARVVKTHSSQIRYCYERELSRKPDLAGKVTLKFTISAAGSVSAAKVAQTTLDDPSVESCLVQRIKTWRFPRPKGGGIVIVSYPFLFRTAP